MFSLPVLLFQAIELAWRAYLPAFLAQSVGIALATVGTLMFGARLLDAAADPVLGWFSDNMTTRFGRRAPFMALGAVLVPAGALLLFRSPPGASVVHVIGASLLLHMGYSLIVTPHGGWGLELSDDKHERTRIMGAKVWFGVFGSIGMLTALAVLERLPGFGVVETARALGVVIAVAAPFTVLGVLACFRERPVAPGTAAAPSPLKLFAGMVRQPGLRSILVLYVLSGLADASTASTFLFFSEGVLGLTGQGASFMLIQPVIALCTLPFWAAASRRLGRRQVLAIGFGWQALTMPLVLAMPAGQPMVFGLFLAVRGLTWGVDYMLLRAMVADLAEQGSGEGPRLSGSYYGVSSVTVKLAMGLGASVALWTVGMAGFEAGSRPGEGAALAIRLAFAMPSVLAGLAGLILLRGGLGLGGGPALARA